MILKESGELVFLRYAFPVIKDCSNPKISRVEESKLMDILIRGGSPKRKMLQELFPRAAQMINNDWSAENVRDYFCFQHNQITENIRCKVYGFVASSVVPSNKDFVCKAVVEGIRHYFPSYFELKKGDFFTVHNFVVAEKLTRETFEKYF